ncbi:MAG: PDZ domain-containing protein [Coraliomargarita sp. TMED73]|nr:MAG: PDZ domain-containing protein [Coraliomargarita sp. TMED73]
MHSFPSFLRSLAHTITLSFCFSCVVQAGKLEVTIDSSPIVPSQAIPLVSYADVIERATPAVVSVYTTDMQTFSGGQDPRVGDILRQFGYRVPYGSNRSEKRPVHGLGSGVIISKDGYIITNNHVVRNQSGEPVDEIRVQLKDGSEVIAELVGTDEKTDVAVIKIDTDSKLDQVIVADSDGIRTGDIVFAIGSPHGQSQTVTQGIVSATERTSLDILGPGSYENFIQTDAAINLGNSGGALIDALGRLVGINTAIVSRSGGSIGLGYAIPVNMALSVARSLIEVGEVPRGLLGLFPVDLTSDLAEAFALDSTEGALVNEVQPDSPAERGGIRHGDIITHIDAIQIESAAQLRLTVSQMTPGREVEVSLIRRGKKLQKKVVLGSLNGKFYGRRGESRLDGVAFSFLDASTREEISLPEEIDGVLVRSVEADSPFANRLRAGMVLIEVNDIAVDSPASVGESLQSGVNSFYVWFEGSPRFVVIRIED